MGNWSKLKVFFLLVFFIGSLVSLSSNILYFYLYSVLEITEYSSTLFLIPLIFFIFSTIIFTKKISGFFKRLCGAISILFFQFFLFIVIFYIFSILDGFTDFATPEFTQGDQEFSNVVKERFNDRYGIDLGNPEIISHSSYWRIGEEFGYDLIVRVREGVHSKYAPEGITFNLLKTNTDDTPFRFSNRQFICGNTMGSDLKISDDKIRNLVCAEQEFPADTLIAERTVRDDWTVTSVFFPSEGILWITETEW
jgi:hypothetical protein